MHRYPFLKLLNSRNGLSYDAAISQQSNIKFYLCTSSYNLLDSIAEDAISDGEVE